MVEQLTDRDVLVVMDMQEVFVEGAGVWGVEGYGEAEKVIEDLRGRFAGRTVLTRFVADPDEPGAWRAYYDAYPSTRLPEGDPAWDLTIDAAPGDVVLTAPTFSKWGPELAGHIALDQRMVLVGVATDCCVISTALAAIDAGREVLVIDDACAGSTRENHTKAMDVMRLLHPMIRVTSSRELAIP